MVRHLTRLTILVFCCLAIVGIILALILAPYLTSKELALEPKEIRIAPGTSTKSIAKQLADERIIRSSLLFEAVAYFDGASRYLQAGTYELSAAMGLREIIQKLKSGEVVHRQFVVPEGLTVAQIAQLLEDKGIGPAEMFSRAARDSQWRKRYGIQGNSLEGYLNPNT
ncbi:MAG: endolytic transglycosylase MltG, partial [Candidatus Poribacteria bacterium]|nr:endolytic transglycosylase MltG [Candidatus Poribacteria bacterium]